ncbi:nitrate reductase subunit alpha [Algoriphagus persicinus]|uniref:nitrate reductase subunit alpha n=1 Tax=Algoriphagus persicinus TaxID=3108754 RepID=UPI002B3E6DA1|nr:nitrate reductase subunit alpha [Algoriphagus sp. E1-3-M2]MEB2785324.1 nitrate reductase subunit alpha [Algoriphagus sp. E1-3-M2]
MSWIEDIISPKTRKWEEFYRNRWQYDKVVRSTHGVNCTGGCSWNIHVKDGIVVWEMQALDYPLLENGLPPYEPRGCQRGISYSWYLYSPVRIKFPLIRGSLLDLYREEKKKSGDPYQAWAAIQNDPGKRSRYQQARGKGGFRRIHWDEALELIAASNLYTVKTYGPDRLIGFSPIPAMSMMSYASGARYLQLMGGVNLSFYDWYCDLPNAFPEIWGEQTDVCESADWYNSKFCVSMGANLGMTRTPDIHFFSESRHNGTKTVVMSPDFSMVAKHADQWIPCHAGSDGAFWMAVTHIILKEWHHEKQTPYFLNYTKRYTDSTFLVELNPKAGYYEAGKVFRANRIAKYKDIENGDWKFLCYNEDSDDLMSPKGTVGYRWGKEKGKWNLKYEDGETGEKYEPLLTLLGKHQEVLQVDFVEYGLDKHSKRGVPVRFIETQDGQKVPVTTIYDLMMAHYGVGRGLDGDYPEDYDTKDQAYTPAWQEIFTGVGRKTVIKFAEEWASTAEATNGKCMVIVGAAINHWFHGNLMYRASIMAQMLTGCNGVNGGGMNHYVGQEKLAPVESWSTIMSGKDWQNAARLQQAPIWHYINSSQWRYDGNQALYNSIPDGENRLANMHSADWVVMSVRNGWMPFYPQYNKSNFEIVEDARKAGADTDEKVFQYVVDKLKSKDLLHSVVDPDDPVNFPRVWFIWRGNALMSSAKGHEYMLNHYLGTHHNDIADEVAGDFVEDIIYRNSSPSGKMDLVVDINFRMDTSALYSDIVLPTASWYEKADLNSTDMHSFIHPLSEAIPPVWESKTDWQIFQAIAKKVSEMAEKYIPEPMMDLVNLPLSHDSVDEISQGKLQDWSKGECEPIPGKTMHKMVLVERDYTRIYQKYITLGQNIAKNGLGAHGNHYLCEDVYEEMVNAPRNTYRENGIVLPSIKEDVEAANAVLKLSTLTNGKLNYRAYKNMEEKTGLVLADLGEGSQDVLMDYKSLQSQPRRYNTSPVWSGLMHNGRAYAAYTYNVDRLVPWRTLTGRQHFYLDHDGYIAFGEHLPTYKPSPTPEVYGDLRKTVNDGKAKMLNCLTPHGKWHIHSTYGDTLRMLTLSRGMEPCWINEQDAAELGIKDNDWVECYNDHGVYCTRACVSARIPKGVCIVYHSPERTYSVPKSQVRGNRRAGGHNSFTRVHLKPNLMVGGYGQFTYHFNYWGPVGVNRDTHLLVRKMDKVVF